MDIQIVRELSFVAVKVTSCVAVGIGLSMGLYYFFKGRKGDLPLGNADLGVLSLIVFVPIVGIVAITLSDKFEGGAAALLGTIAGFLLSTIRGQGDRTDPSGTK